MTKFTLVALLATLWTSPERLSIRISNPLLEAGHSEQVTCRVPPDARNRWLEIGIEDYRSSGIQLEGERAPITHQVLFLRVPCEAGAAYCTLSRNDSTSEKVLAKILISGCQDTILPNENEPIQ